MCRLCTYVCCVCFKQHTHFRIPAYVALGATHNSQKHWQTRPRLKTQQELNTATWLPLVSGICPFVIEAPSSECECIF